MSACSYFLITYFLHFLFFIFWHMSFVCICMLSFTIKIALFDV